MSVYVRGRVHYFCKDPCSNLKQKIWSTILHDIGSIELVINQ